MRRGDNAAALSPLLICASQGLGFDYFFEFGFFLWFGCDGLGFGVFAVDDLTVFEQGDHAAAASDIASYGRDEPRRIADPWGFAGEGGSKDLAAGGNAVSEVAKADDEGQHPDDHDGAGYGM